ncbi:DUF4185 domain-containing protein [Dermacoccaceae bacterium W4C1]
MPQRFTRTSLALLAAASLAGCSVLSSGSQPRHAEYDGPIATAASSTGSAARSTPLSPSEHEMSQVTGLSPTCPAPQGKRTWSAADWNARMSTLSMPQWLAADAGISAPLSDGRVVWLFGDTLRPAGESPNIWANSVAISSGTCFSQMLVKGDEPAISLGRFDRACWPSAMITVPVTGGDRLMITCSRIKRERGGLLSFEYLGASLATYFIPKGGTPRPESFVRLTPESRDQQQINWGAALLAGEDGRLYIYGSRQPDPEHGAKAVYLARTDLDRPTDFTTWQYWNGSGWSTGKPEAAQEVLPASVGVSQAFTVHRYRGQYMLVSKKGGEAGRDIGLWMGPSPVGPWRLVSTKPYTYDDGSGYVTYQPVAHPELTTGKDTVIVSLSRNPTDFSDLRPHPGRARPIFVEMPTS